MGQKFGSGQPTAASVIAQAPVCVVQKVGVEADARRYMEMGATLVAVGSDLGVFRSATQALKDRYINQSA